MREISLKEPVLVVSKGKLCTLGIGVQGKVIAETEYILRVKTEAGIFDIPEISVIDKRAA